MTRFLGQRLVAAARLARFERNIEASINRALAKRKAAALTHHALTASGDFDDWDTDIGDEVEPEVQAMMDELVASVIGKFPVDQVRVLGQIDVAGQVENFMRLVKGIGPFTATRINEALALGVGSGESVPQLAARVEDVFAMAERKAATIARTEVARASNATGYAAAGAVNQELPLSRSWLATSDDRCRDSHSQAEDDNVEVPFDEPLIVGGYECEYPGDPSLPPEESISCRCVLVWSETDSAQAQAAADEAEANAE